MDVDSIPAPWPNREEDVNISSTFLSLLYILPTQYTKEFGGRGGGSEERGVTYLRLQRSIYIERNECGIWLLFFCFLAFCSYFHPFYLFPVFCRHPWRRQNVVISTNNTIPPRSRAGDRVGSRDRLWWGPLICRIKTTKEEEGRRRRGEDRKEKDDTTTTTTTRGHNIIRLVAWVTQIVTWVHGGFPGSLFALRAELQVAECVDRAPAIPLQSLTVGGQRIRATGLTSTATFERPRSMSEPVSFNNNNTQKKRHDPLEIEASTVWPSRDILHTHIRIKGLKLTLTWNELSCPVGTRYAKKKPSCLTQKSVAFSALVSGATTSWSPESREREKQIRPDEK